MSNAWKSAERQAAQLLGGSRNSRGGDFGKSAPDVEHPLFAVECKYRKQLPRLLRLGLEQAARYDSSKPPLLVVKERHQRGALVVLRLSDFVDLLGPLGGPATGEKDQVAEKTHTEHERGECHGKREPA